MKCADCEDGLMPRPQLRQHAIRLAAAISVADLSAEQRAGFACYGLLLTAELGTRCRSCADSRLMKALGSIAEKAAPE